MVEIVQSAQAPLPETALKKAPKNSAAPRR
jgi:hypothetical protein